MIEGKFVSAVIVAAGSGTRMGGVSKPFIKLDGKTLFEIVLDTFLSSAETDEIIVVCKDKIDFEEITSHKSGKPIRFAAGGDTRTESVRNGVKATSRKTDIIVSHDCARPFISSEKISELVKATLTHGAAAAATKATDTVKIVDPKTGKASTPNRDDVWLVQTPQCFGKDVYISAYAVGKKSGTIFTDETSMIENAGFTVTYVECGKNNIKLTTREDIIHARAIYSALTK